MARTRVKICGICWPEDALAAARAGADAIGMVFDPEAGRCVREADVPGILAVVPPFVSRVALFVNHSVEDIKSVLQDHPFSAVQLHGDESPEFVDDLKPTRVIKAIHLAPRDTEMIELWRGAIRELQLTNLAGILLETPTHGRETRRDGGAQQLRRAARNAGCRKFRWASADHSRRGTYARERGGRDSAAASSCRGCQQRG